MAELEQNPKLSDYQEYIKEICRERGWDKNNPLEIFLLFSEEVGELAKAIRNRLKLYHEIDKIKDDDGLDLELADIFSYLLDIANYYNVDLERAFRKKEEKNKKRQWENSK
jgi:NTP pyrophosphatase (non-canonical NTP hydrolase)